MISPSPVLLIFIDGLGLAPDDPGCNPLARFSPKILNCYSNRLGPFPRGGLCIPTDACLGVPGVPQSATGQATLFTGVNASALLGQHLSGFPNSQLRLLLEKHSIVTELTQRGFDVSFANTYTPEFFKNRPRWVSATTVMCEAAGLRLNLLSDVQAGRSLFMDFTNELLRDHRYDVPLRSPKEAGSILAHLAQQNDFCFYEYFLTDHCGHRGTPEENLALLRQLDSFLLAIIELVDLTRFSVVLTSDHGNIEDCCRNSHTTNHVPTLLWGPICRLVDPALPLDLTGIAPLIKACVTGQPAVLNSPRQRHSQ